MTTNPRPLPRSPFRVPNAAFTLVELVLVLTIIAVLAGSAIFMLKGNVEVAKAQRAESDIQSIGTQLQLFESRNYRPPTTEQGLQALVEKPASEPIPEKWTQLLEAVPKDPWGVEYLYKSPAEKSSGSYDLYSSGPDRVADNEDDVGNWK